MGHGREQGSEVARQAAGYRGPAVEPGGRGLDHRPGVLAPPGEGFEQHEPERVDVNGGVDRLAPHLLGRQIGGGARNRARCGGDRAVERAGDPEIGEAGFAAVVEQDVRGLDVAVDEAARVDVGQCGREPGAQAQDVGGGQGSFVEARGERGPVDQVGDEIGAAVRAGLGAAVVQRDQPGMAQRAQRLDLPVLLDPVPG